ncbi:MAG: hypothetical protein M3Q05_06050, partial [Bacteroidota bacterium]|nr:hypothetical protein [Bacteroidota bacterium]
METFDSIKLKARILFAAAGIGFMILLPNMVSAQNKGQKAPIKKGKQLKEVTITARVITEVQEVAPMKVRLNVINPTGKPVNIAILNFDNTPVYKTTFKDREYNKILNFDSTASGRYSLHVKGPKQKEEVRRFAINKGESRDMTESELQKSESTDVMATIFKTAPTQIKLLMVNNTGKPVEYI